MPVSVTEPYPIRVVPPMKYKTTEQEEEGKTQYEEQKNERKYQSPRKMRRMRSMSTSDDIEEGMVTSTD